MKRYKAINLTVVLYGFDTWFVTLREEHRLRVFDKRVMKILGPKREEVGGSLEKTA
jgi:hypothetical protein